MTADLTGDRRAIADAASTVAGVTGHVKRPGAPRVGDAWPLLAGLNRSEHPYAWLATWRVLVALPADEVAASEWLDGHAYELADALTPFGFVFDMSPVLVDTEAGGTKALQITLRSE